VEADQAETRRGRRRLHRRLAEERERKTITVREKTRGEGEAWAQL
jgi:hypothetical protein